MRAFFFIIFLMLSSGIKFGFSDEFIYPCNNLEWIHYNNNDDPATDGIYVGEHYLGGPIYVGRSQAREIVLGAAHIHTQDPKGAYQVYAGSDYHTSNPQFMWYLKSNPDYLFEWVDSSNGEILPFAVDTGNCEVDDGYNLFISKVDLGGGFTTIGHIPAFTGGNWYTDLNNNMRQERSYQVLTCRSKIQETKEICPPTPLPPVICANEWKTFHGDDAPNFDGLSASFIEGDQTAYVGKAWDQLVMKPGSIEANKAGIAMTSYGRNYQSTTNVSYLVDNPDFTYYWVDSRADELVPNAVTIEFNPGAPHSVWVYIGRGEVNGEMKLGWTAIPAGFFYPGADGFEHYVKNYQVLACDPKPRCKCNLDWIPYQGDDAPASDGISVGYNTNEEISYIGRKVKGSNSVIRKVQTSGDAGVFYLGTSKSKCGPGTEKKAKSGGEYLRNNTNSIYNWITTHTDGEVKNALEVQVQGGKAYIGRAEVDGFNFVGTVYKNRGLVVADADGKEMTLSSFQVLTCVAREECL